MADEQQRLVVATAVEPHDQILLAVVGAEDVEVALGESGVTETLRHGLGGGRHVPHGVGSVDLDQLFENVVGKLPGGIVDLGLGGESKEKKNSHQQALMMFQPELLGKPGSLRVPS
jgi:hypothetical protein